MALQLEEIAWGEALLPARPDAAWESEIRRRGAHVSEVDRRVASSPWLREAALGLTTYRPVAMPQHLFDIGAMVTAQENACRYCYGANRAYMKILGYSEDFIRRVEHDMHLADLDDKEHAFIAYCRSLARSRPRPTRSACDKLVALGFSRQAVHEMAFVIAMGCCYNRLSTLLACPPEHDFERMAYGPIGRVIGLARRWSSRILPRRSVASVAASFDAAALTDGPFGAVLAPLAGLPGGRIMKDALDGAFTSDVLDRRTKALMFAIVARTLDCGLCESVAAAFLEADGLSTSDIASALTSFRSEHLPAGQDRLLTWTRSTVHYDTAKLQQETRALAESLDDTILLEAIGVASLANAAVRLATLNA